MVLVQLLLGAGSWVVKFGMPEWFIQWFGETSHVNRESDLASAAILAAHGAVGALIVAGAVVVSLYARRRIRTSAPAAATIAAPLTGAPA